MIEQGAVFVAREQLRELIKRDDLYGAGAGKLLA